MNNENKDTTKTTNTENTSQDNTLKGRTDTDKDIKSSLKEPNRNNKSEDGGAFWVGIGQILLVNILVPITLLVVIAAIPVFLTHNNSYFISQFVKFLEFFGNSFAQMIGLSQLTYVIPWAIKLHKSGKPLRAQGIIAGAVITAFIQGSCYVSMNY